MCLIFLPLPNCAGNFSDECSERLRNRRGAIERRVVSNLRNLDARLAVTLYKMGDLTNGSLNSLSYILYSLGNDYPSASSGYGLR